MNGGRFKKIFERIHFELRCFKWRRHAKYFLDKETNPDIHRSDTFSFNLWTARNHILGCCPAFSANFLCYLTQAENMIFVEASLTKFLMLLCWGRGKPLLLHSWRVCVPPEAPHSICGLCELALCVKYVKSDTWPHQHKFIQPPPNERKLCYRPKLFESNFW